MAHLPDLIRDLAFILITAAFVTLIFKKFKQPVVLGYLIAGFVLGPNFPFFVGVKDTSSITTWSEIGVIFLLFGLGLEFSFKKLSSVGKSAGITAFIEAVSMLAIGYATGKILGWNTMDSIYLGGVLSVSSTTIIVRAFDELGLKGKKFVSLVFGVLIVEDLIAILLLVLLTTVAVSDSLSGAELFNATLRLGFFLTLWFLIGIFIIPNLLQKIRKLLTPETTVVISIGLCLLMVLIATNVGFSAPLGAFIMGSILAETREGHNIEHLLNPIKDLFAAVFFVSVGMMIDPHTLMEYSGTIVIITIVTIIGKFISSGFGALLSGQSLKTSVQSGLSLAQIGEFSFIIATLGMSLKVTSDFIYPVAVAVSAVTTFTTPYLIKYSERFYYFIEPFISQKVKDQLHSYENTFNSKSQEGPFRILWQAFGIRILLNSIMVGGIVLFTEKILLNLIPEEYRFSGIGVLVSLILAAPFLWAIMFGNPSKQVAVIYEKAYMLKNLLVGITLLRFTLGIGLVFAIISNFTTLRSAYLISFIVIISAIFMLRNFVAPYYQRIESRFINNLNEKEREELEKKSKMPILTPWDAVLVEFTVSPNSIIVGKTLEESTLKEKFGVTVALIERGNQSIIAPGRDTLLMSYDKLFLIGNDTELDAAKKLIEEAAFQNHDDIKQNYGLESFTLSAHSPFIEKSIRECGLREKINGLIVGIERDGNRYLNPDSGMILKAGDLLWVVADSKKVKLV